MKKRQQLIEIITKHLETIKYKRNNNFEQYSLQDLIKVCEYEQKCFFLSLNNIIILIFEIC